MRRGLIWIPFLVATAWAGSAPATRPQSSQSTGIVVERVDGGGAAEKAGLQPGDRLERWSRLPKASGPLPDPFILWETELEEPPQGPVTLHGHRGDKPLQWALPPGDWKAVARPDLSGEDMEIHERAAQLAKAGDADGAIAAWGAIAARAQKGPNPGLAYWVQRRCASALLEARRYAEAKEAYSRAFAAADALHDPRLAAQAVEGKARTLEAARDLQGAEVAWEEAAGIREQSSGESLALASTLSSLGVVAWKLGKNDEALLQYRSALAIRERIAPDSLPVAASLVNLSTLERQRGDYDASRNSLLRALSIQEKILPDGLDVVKSLNNLGFLAETRGDLDSAERCYTRAMSIQERLAPRSSIAATLLDNLGNVARIRSDYHAAERYFRQSLALREEIAPGSLDVANSLNNLGILYRVRGDLARAQENYAGALALYLKQAPSSPEAATILMNLGIVAMQRGDLAAAEQYCTRSLEQRERATPGGLPVAASRTTLGLIAWYRNDLPRAEDEFLCARDIYAQHTPDSLQEAMALNNLGTLFYEQGRLDEAQQCHSLALGMKERLVPGGMESSASLINLALVERLRGDLDVSAAYARSAMEIRARLAPDSLEEAECYSQLGTLAADRHDWPAAEHFYRLALAIRERLAPESVREAETLHDLGVALRDGGQREEAIETLCRALASLEAQSAKMGGPESARERFAEKHGRFYWDYMDLLLKEGHRESAFAVSERSRARLLLEMLSSRDLDLGGEVPPDLSLDAERVEADLERTQKDLAGLPPGCDPGRMRELEAERETLKRRQEALRESIRFRDPRLGALRYPQTLDLPAAFAVLDPGTLFLEYAVGEEETLLFALGPGPGEYAVFTLPAGGPGLRLEVSRYIEAVRAGGDSASLSTKLSRKLLHPVRDQIRRAKRLLVSPDGCLNLLPFCALRDPNSKSFRYLAESKATSCTVSISLFSELKRGRGRGLASAGAAFGDPLSPAIHTGDAGISTASPVLRQAIASGCPLSPLPFAREEVEALASHRPGEIRVWLGEEATEERAKGLPRDMSLVHFACHAYADTTFPLDSALVLTIPQYPRAGAEDGLLQAWEIFEKVRVNADLVTLSACETALGRDVGGEGIIGLTRALHYAGARSVISSLWSVSDQSTAGLMRRFYLHLTEGFPRDEALRLAQLDLIQGAVGNVSRRRSNRDLESAPAKDWSPPFFWAGFQVYGDAR